MEGGGAGLVPWEQGIQNRVAGADAPGPGCAGLVECLPSLQHYPNRPEDVLKVDVDDNGAGGDDTADCLRYLVATKSRVVTQRKLRGT